MENVKVNLHQKDPREFEVIDGKYFADGKEVSPEEAIAILVEAAEELGYWCQVAKDILPEDWFEEVQLVYADRPE